MTYRTNVISKNNDLTNLDLFIFVLRKIVEDGIVKKLMKIT